MWFVILVIGWLALSAACMAAETYLPIRGAMLVAAACGAGAVGFGALMSQVFKQGQ